MDKTTIQTMLTQIAQEEIPEDMTLWHDIEKRLNQRAIRRQRMILQVARIAAVFVMLSLVAAVSYAVYQMGINDATIPQEQITPLGIEQTIEDVTLVLDWAYADSHRIGLAYTLTFDQATPIADYHFVTLSRTDGTVIPQAFGGGGGGGGGGSDSLVILSSLFNFDASVITDTPEMLDLILTVQYGGEPPLGFATDSNQGGQGGSGGGSGGGGGGSAQPTPVDPATIPVRTYEIAFSVPFIQAATANAENPEISVNDVTMTLGEVSIAPSMTVFDLCYTLPEGMGADWTARVLLDTGILAEDFMNTGMGLPTPDGRILFSASANDVPQQNDAGQWCNTFTAQALFSDSTDRITITVPYLQRAIAQVDAETLDGEIAYFAAQGYEIAIEPIADPRNMMTEGNVGIYPLPDGSLVAVTISSHPEGIDENGAMSTVMSQFLVERYLGEWSFEAVIE